MYACSSRSLLRRLSAERVLDELGLVGGGEEQVQLRQQRLQEPIFLDRLALGDELVRIARQRVAVGDGHGPLASGTSE